MFVTKPLNNSVVNKLKGKMSSLLEDVHGVAAELD
jgi:hypothetical protein